MYYYSWESKLTSNKQVDISNIFVNFFQFLHVRWVKGGNCYQVFERSHFSQSASSKVAKAGVARQSTVMCSADVDSH